MALARCYLGCPVWSNRDWIGELFTAGSKPDDFLRQYSAAFNTVEGNNCFYGLPKPETVLRWREDAAPGFRFCFKFPRAISHERRLRHCAAETTEFLNRLTPLAEADRMGPSFLQLPPSFGPSDLLALRDYLTTLPQGFQYAVEVRHRAFFAKGEDERQLNRLLLDLGIDRVMLDSRALFSADPVDSDTRIAQSKKPRLPVHAISLGPRPFIRYIGHPDLEANRPFLEPWLDKLALWLSEGREPHVFIHTPNNRLAPHLARRFHEMLQARCPEVGALPS
ncbi:MAG TPA: DUF72 domain-containing protein [Candidatus Competibacteraceae bacterium]|nr:DUF72 domain-containing protein [Candidatus Competibacteraceae bacterium]HRZ04711.1 DUF72 domain-containing protein [Candidatus Competibacteraceae bacterium]HSA45835.1 DUF72 domain-containing protein [Candidatus Competibacteraceae bacterium]